MHSMRAVLLTVFIAFITVCPSAQSNPSETNESNLYSLALKASILRMEEEWGNLGHGPVEDKIRIPIDYRHMLVSKDPIITDDLPAMFKDHSIEFVDDQELMDRYRKLKKSFAVLRISPIRNKGNVLEVVISTDWVSYRKNRLDLAYSDWSVVEFRYDCERGAFVTSSVKLGGV